MIDRKVYIINGWSVFGDNVAKMEQELYDIDEYYNDDIQDYFVYDTMCGEYIYFGAIIDSFNPDEDPLCITIDEKSIYDADQKYKQFLEEYPHYAEIFKKYANNQPPQVMVVLKTW